MTKDIHFRPSIDYIYNPDNQTKQQLIESFVVRLKTFQRLFEDIKEASMQSPEQHYLIEGKRGMGKTTLLLRLSYEIENSPELNTWLLPIVFNEEEYSIRRLYKFWERIAVLLEEKDSIFDGLYDEMDTLYDAKNETEYEYTIYQLLNQKLEQHQKKLILFIDNFGDIFSKFNKQEIQRLRTVLQTNTNLRIFSASSTVLEAFYDNKHPFFDFFKVKRLTQLDKSETNDLLLKLGETYNKSEQIKEILATQAGRVESLRRLTGGVIRTIVLMFEIFVDQKQGNTFSDLDAILDRVTPLYKHRMDDLPAQQQEIVEAIAFAWDAINVSEISQKTRIPSKTVSAQLRQMEKNEIIQKKLTNTKNHLYQVSERFFNIWYLMRHGRKGDKRKVLWLIRFLEEWCDEKELVTRTQQHISMLKAGNYHISGGYYLTEALAATKSLPKESQHELLCATRDFLKKKNSDFLQHLSESDIELHEKAMAFYEKEEYDKALPIFLKMKEKDEFRIAYCYHDTRRFEEAEKYYLISINNDNSVAMNNLAGIYKDETNEIEKAEKLYLQSISKGNIMAMYNIALLYQGKSNDFNKAEKYYLMAAKKGYVKAMNNLANLYRNEFKDYKRAEKYYLLAVKKDHDTAAFNLALLCENEFQNFQKAIKYYLLAAKKGLDEAIFNLALLYEDKLEAFKKAEEYYLMAVDKEHPSAMNNLALLYKNEFQNFQKAEKYFLMAIQKEHARAMYNLALLYDTELEDFQKAEKYYLMAIEHNYIDAMYNLALLYDNELENPEKAEKYYLMAAEKGHPVAMNNLAYNYYCELINKEKALQLAERAYQIENEDASRLTYAKNLLWNDKNEQSKKIAKEFLYEKNYFTVYLEFFSDYLFLLLAKNEYQFLYNYFTSPEAEELHIKDQLKPIWYALMYYMQDEHPNEYLRMGEELEETVKEIIQEVEQMRIDYA